MFIETLPQVNLEHYSEKDMIGSLLDDEETENDSPSRSRQSPDSLRRYPEIRESNPSGSEQKTQENNLYEFPSVAEGQQNFSFQIYDMTTQSGNRRIHSQSYEDQQFYSFNQSTPYFNKSYQGITSQSYKCVPQTNDQKQYNNDQDSYFSQKRSRKTLQYDLQNDGQILLKCQDQYASLQLQQQFENGSEHQRDKIFQALEPELPFLTKHKFGNYVIQKIVEKGSLIQRQIVFDRIQGQFLDMSFDKFGCRVIQKILEFIVNKPQQQEIFLSVIKPHIFTLIFDQCGNHVVQKTIEQIPMINTLFVLQVVEQNADQIVSHSYGCRIAQKCLEIYSSEQLLNLYNLLNPLINKLSFCSYGNYIVQHMINNAPQMSVKIIHDFILTYIYQVCCDKFASNVAQRFIQKNENLECFGDAIFSTYIGQMFQIIFNNNYRPLIVILINDQFGNYVIQQFYCLCSDKHKLLITQFALSDNESIMTQYGNKLFDKQILGRHFVRFLSQ